MFDVAGKGKYFIDFKNGSGSVGEGDPGSKPDVTISMNEEVFLKIFNRKCRFLTQQIVLRGLNSDFSFSVDSERSKALGRKVYTNGQ